MYTVDSKIDKNIPLQTHLSDLVEPIWIAVDAESDVTDSLGKYCGYSFLGRVIYAPNVLQVLYHTYQRRGAAIVNLCCCRLRNIVLLDLFANFLCLVGEFRLSMAEKEKRITFDSDLVFDFGD